MGCDVSLLGEVKGVWGGREVDLGPSKQRAFFAVLAIRANEVVSQEELIRGVWGERAPATVKSSVYTYVARLRRALEPQGGPRGHSRFLVQEGSGYRLRIAPHLIDANRFRAHHHKARSHYREGRLHCAVTELDRALAMWRGSAFAGLSGPYIEAERNRLEERRFTAIEERLDILLRIGRTGEALGELSTLARTYPLRERVRELLMRAYHQSGRRAEALMEFRDIRNRLISELGIEPCVDLQAAHEEILRGDGRPGPGHHPLRSSPPVRQPAAPVPAQLPHDVSAFTGRQPELGRLRTLLNEAEIGNETPVLVIDGAPGRGKTALAVRFAHEVAWRFGCGHLFVDMGGSEPLSATQACDIILDSLGMTVPHGGVDADKQRAGFYRSALAGRRLLIVLDDAHSAEQVRPLLPGTAGCLVLVTSRNRLSGLTARDGASLVTLDVMPRADAIALMRRVVARAGGAPPENGLLREVAHACGYLPAAVRAAAERIAALGAGAVAEALSGQSLLDLLDSGSDSATSVRGIVEASLSQLPNSAMAMFVAFGSVPHAELTLPAACEMVGANLVETRARLDVLVRARLVARNGADRYQMKSLFHDHARELHRLKSLPAPRGRPFGTDHPAQVMLTSGT